jgi:hypothetical protein
MDRRLVGLQSRSRSGNEGKESRSCNFGAFQSGCGEDSDVSGYYAMSTSKWLPTFEYLSAYVFRAKQFSDSLTANT